MEGPTRVLLRYDHFESSLYQRSAVRTCNTFQCNIPRTQCPELQQFIEDTEFLQHRRRQPQTQNAIPYLAFSSLSSKPQLPMPAVLKNKPSTPFGQGKRVRTGGREQAMGLEFTSSSSLDVSSPPPAEVGDFQAAETLRLMFSRASQPSQWKSGCLNVQDYPPNWTSSVFLT